MLGDGIYMTPTCTETSLMGLACSKPVGPEDGYKITYYAPQPRAAIEVVSFDDYDRVVPYGQTGFSEVRFDHASPATEPFVLRLFFRTGRSLQRRAALRTVSWDRAPCSGAVSPVRLNNYCGSLLSMLDLPHNPAKCCSIPASNRTLFQTFHHRRNARQGEPGQHWSAQPRYANVPLRF